jgi:hypothetical protein
VHQVGDEFDRVGDEADRAGRKSRIAAGGMVAFGKSGRLAGRAVVTGFGAASAAVVGAGIVLAKVSKDSIGEAREAQKVGAISLAQVKATGRAANISAKGIRNLSGRISAKVGIDDEEIQAGANKILMYKNVRNELGRGNKIFDRATMGAVNLSAVTGTLTTNSKLLGKVLNDPTKAITGLTKAGVKFTDQQIKQIGNFTKQGDLLRAQKIVLKQVEDRVGGVAAAQATWGEKSDVMLGNIQERFGTALLPVLDRTQRWFVREGGPAVDGFVDKFERKGIPVIERYAGIFERRGIPAIKNFVDEGRPLVGEILPAAGAFLGTAADAFGVIGPKAQSVFKAFNDLPDWAKSAVAIGAGGAVVGKKLGAFSLGKSVLGGITSKAPLPVYVVNSGAPGVPGVPKGSKPSDLAKRGLPFLPALAAPQVAAGASIFAGGVASEAILQRQLRASVENSMRSKSSVLRGGAGTVRPDVLAANQAGDALWRASLAKNWPEVIRLAREYKDVLHGSVTGQQQLQRAGYMFTSAYGRDLQGVIGRLDTADAKVNNLRTSLLGVSAVGSYGNGMGVLAPSPKPRPSRPRGRVASRDAFPAPEPVRPIDDDFFGRSSGAGGDIHVHNYIDGEKVSETVINRLGHKEARR